MADHRPRPEEPPYGTENPSDPEGADVGIDPAHDDLTIVVNLKEETSRISPWHAHRTNAVIRMFSLNGASIHEQSCRLTDVLHVDLSAVPSGIYTVQVTTSTGTVITRRVVVVH